MCCSHEFGSMRITLMRDVLGTLGLSDYANAVQLIIRNAVSTISGFLGTYWITFLPFDRVFYWVLPFRDTVCIIHIHAIAVEAEEHVT